MRISEIMAPGEGHNRRESLSEAMWWVQRWVSGSMGDPDWDESWLSQVKDVATAFEIIHVAVGNHSCAGTPLWRYLRLPHASAQAMRRDKLLMPSAAMFQSFTPSKSLAVAFGQEGSGSHNGDTDVVVCADIPEQDVMFGMQDLLKSRLPVVRDHVKALDNWHHQREVIVRIRGPVALREVQLLGAQSPGRRR